MNVLTGLYHPISQSIDMKQQDLQHAQHFPQPLTWNLSALVRRTHLSRLTLKDEELKRSTSTFLLEAWMLSFLRESKRGCEKN